jgi:malate dehydrogenase (oxaloacetate-decarboxylating)
VSGAAALCEVVAGDLRADHIVPSPFEPGVASAVAAAVAAQARADGATRTPVAIS